MAAGESPATANSTPALWNFGETYPEDCNAAGECGSQAVVEMPTEVRP
jgi:hypothetical protein